MSATMGAVMATSAIGKITSRPSPTGLTSDAPAHPADTGGIDGMLLRERAERTGPDLHPARQLQAKEGLGG
jgi:hypothetical protein